MRYLVSGGWLGAVMALTRQYMSTNSVHHPITVAVLMERPQQTVVCLQ